MEPGTKVTVHANQTPSAEVVAKATAEATVTDSQGRAITLRKPGVLAQYRLIEIVGDSAKNEVYMGMVLPIIYVSAINGEAVSQPSSKRELEAIIQLLDDHGVNAVMTGTQEHFGPSDPEADQKALKK